MVHPPSAAEATAAEAAAVRAARPGSTSGSVPARPARRRIGRATAALAPAGLMLALGLWGIGREGSMWRDESTTYQVAHRDLGEITHMLGNADVVHGLYYLLMHGLFALWDGGLVALRLPSVLGMAAAAAGVGLIGHRLAGPRAGLAAGLVFPLIPAVQEYAQEGRSYALVCALVVWSTHALLGAVARPRAWAWVRYAAVSALACLLHEFAVLALLAHGATLHLARATVPEDVRWRWGRAATCAVLPMAPLVVVSQQQANLVGWIPRPDAAQLLGFAAPALAGLLLAKAPVSAAAGPVRLRTLALPLLILPPALLMAVSYLHPLYVDRYVLYSHVGLALLLGAALDWALRAARRRGTLAVGTVLGLATAAVAALLPPSLHLRTPESRLDDTVSAARAVRELSEPGDGVLFLPARRREPMMSRPEDFAGLRNLALSVDAVTSGTLHGVELPAAEIRTRMLTADRIVTVNDPPGGKPAGAPEEQAKREVLSGHFAVCEQRAVKGMRIILYARPGKCGPRPH
ncbi:glycosyltransferase family 39 protein [Streptomyces sp. XD-27]|uniref:glycosyltransferase family 39 protein n=1 Tax=Streptomyces sp. XD-27 TaxID=3062779 RepID=UPI0026F47B95|nr:glycosyltransferase family 39 protein [Streptomyces sp. XD-27]WKX69784.1 glycosyltransferase family 39 protein [Streptomyces sp. XD-27]